MKGSGLSFAVAPFFQRADCNTAAFVKHLACRKQDVMQEGNENCLHSCMAGNLLHIRM